MHLLKLRSGALILGILYETIQTILINDGGFKFFLKKVGQYLWWSTVLMKQMVLEAVVRRCTMK